MYLQGSTISRDVCFGEYVVIGFGNAKVFTLNSLQYQIFSRTEKMVIALRDTLYIFFEDFMKNYLKSVELEENLFDIHICWKNLPVTVQYSWQSSYSV